MLANGCYFLFFCRGFKLVGPMVIMIYRWQTLQFDKNVHETQICLQNVGSGSDEIWNNLLHLSDGIWTGLLSNFHELWNTRSHNMHIYEKKNSIHCLDENPMDSPVESILQVRIIIQSDHHYFPLLLSLSRCLSWLWEDLETSGRKSQTQNMK